MSGGGLDLTQVANSPAPFPTCEFDELELVLSNREFAELELIFSNPDEGQITQRAKAQDFVSTPLHQQASLGALLSHRQMLPQQSSGTL